MLCLQWPWQWHCICTAWLQHDGYLHACCNAFLNYKIDAAAMEPAAASQIRLCGTAEPTAAAVS
jgi:hypothetical protein